MGRKRIGKVIEPIETLQRMLSAVSDSALVPRLQLLIALKAQPDVKAEVLMGVVGHSERTIRRWWKQYREGGLARLLDGWSSPDLVCEQSSGYDSEHRRQLIALVNSLPTSNDKEEWRSELEAKLSEYVGKRTVVRFAASTGDDDSSAPGHGNIPIRDSRGRDLGWLEIDDDDRETVTASARLESLTPFLSFLFADISVRSNVIPISKTRWEESLMNNHVAAHLSPRERDVLLRRMQGYTYAETAQLLNVSEETVRKCVKTIYQKTGASSVAEIFNQFFPALLESMSAPGVSDASRFDRR